jgi:hypothetical protein
VFVTSPVNISFLCLFVVQVRAASKATRNFKKMSLASLSGHVAAGDASGPHLSDNAPDRLQLLQRVETLELQAVLDAQHIAQLREQNKAHEDVLHAERARGEKYAEAFMHIARTCDDRVDELKAQHAAALRVKDDAVATLKAELEAVKASQAAAITKLETQHAAATAALHATNAALKFHVAALQAQTTSKLTDLHAAIAVLRTLEIHPVRPDCRQFAEWHTGPVPALPTPLPLPLPSPPPMTFDRDWCTAASGTKWKVDLDAATGMRAHVVQTGYCCLTLRSAAPLPREPALGQLPAYRIVVEAHNQSQSSLLGFLPSHHARAGTEAEAVAAAVTPIAGEHIWNYGGWSIEAHATSACDVKAAMWSGWTALEPSCDVAGGNTSAYATTSNVPPMPRGSAVEFAVDYAAGTCRVAFYSPAVVAAGFVEAPDAKMELRFIATEANERHRIPARSVPTLADSGVELYPAADTSHCGTIWRLAP